MTRTSAIVRLALAALAGALCIRDARADLIDFERRPSGALPADNDPIANPYSIEGGGTVRFFFDVNGNNVYDPGVDVFPRFERAGASDPDHGFVGAIANDTAAPGFEAQLGNYFARQPTFNANIPGPFIADYDTAQTITALSGEIWDIDGLGSPTDGTEQWRVDVLDNAGSVLASMLSPLGTEPTISAPLDSRPWTFAFTGLPDGVRSVRLTFIGTKTQGIGLAFNNFSPTVAIPEPASLSMLSVGILGLIGYGWRRHKAAA